MTTAASTRHCLLPPRGTHGRYVLRQVLWELERRDRASSPITGTPGHRTAAGGGSETPARLPPVHPLDMIR